MKLMGGRFGRFLVIPRLMAKARLLYSMMKDWFTGAYPRVPYRSISALVLALAYLFNPFDLVPDYLIGLGQIDDVVVLGLCLYLSERDLVAYEAWKAERKGSGT